MLQVDTEGKATCKEAVAEVKRSQMETPVGGIKAIAHSCLSLGVAFVLLSNYTLQHVLFCMLGTAIQG